ncbi:serine/threonine-protein kinase [Pelomonas saccharophila]|uniref:Serine/threonine-protein kinase n=1 Tax=Roseateles saccharophilus TaxID=304 RepID=A0ABU1YM18_ROSSA|nr:protein kinase [Roseateles saccharophilus]MDR7269907.1 serine/threonine-protein kinase [Roseateles saccharophilus]
MNTSDRAGALAAFDAWQDASPPEREALLSELPPAQRERLEALINADRAAEAGGFLEQPAPLPNTPELAGQVLGAWTLVAPLGSGGMGEVWRARRSDGAHQGEAAIKLLHSPWRGEAAQARFRREGELLARLTHPHIARLLDIGETLIGATRTRYLVLELVDGERIDRWCEVRNLDVAARLQLFLQVCDAVAHAHARLVVHRDLKPGNILVTADGQVKLLDFGVAKLLEGDTGAELTAQVPAGLTPEYAAPEQLRGEPVSTATDVFALGRLLCLLLTRQREPGPELHGDLALIVGRSLKERPDERYAGASALADDVRRHLEHRPILARPDSLAYRSAKFARRYRLQLVALSLVLASLLAGMVATAWQWHEATREAERTRRVQSVLTQLLSGLSPDASGSATVPMIELLRRSWAEAKRRLEDDPALLAEVARPLGLLLAQSGDMTLAAEALALSHAQMQGRGEDGRTVALELAHAQRRLGHGETARQLLTPLLVGHDDDPVAVSALTQLGEMALEAGRLEEAQLMLQRAERGARARFGPTHERYARVADAQASLARAQGRWDDVRRWTAAVVSASANSGRMVGAQARMAQATMEVELGRYAVAVGLLRASVKELSEVLGPANLNTLYTRTWLANALFHHGLADEAEREALAALKLAQGSGDADAAAQIGLVAARLQLRRGDVAGAQTRLSALLAELQTSDVTAAERARTLLGEAALRRGDAAGALVLLEQADRTLRARLGERDADRWLTLALSGLAHEAAGHAGPASTAYREALALGLAGLPAGHPDLARLRALVALGEGRDVFAALANYADALAERADASAIRARLTTWRTPPSSPLPPGLALLDY